MPQKILRPLRQNPIFKLYIINNRFNQINKSDKRIISQIGCYFVALICADLKSKIHIHNIDKYTNVLISYGTLSCKVISGRQIRFNNLVNPKRH